MIDKPISLNINSILWKRHAEWAQRVFELDSQSPKNREQSLRRDIRLEHARTAKAYFGNLFEKFGKRDLENTVNEIFGLKFPPEIVVGPGEYDLSVTWVVDRDKGDGYFKFILLPLIKAACVSYWDGKSIGEPLMEVWFTDIDVIARCYGHMGLDYSPDYSGIYLQLRNSKGDKMDILTCGIHSWQRREVVSVDKILGPQEHEHDNSYSDRFFVSLIKPGYLCNCDIRK